MTSYKLTYFDFDGGRGETIRIAFHAAGIDFEDIRWSFPEFSEMRHEVRFSAVPVLEIDGAVAFTRQSESPYGNCRSELSISLNTILPVALFNGCC